MKKVITVAAIKGGTGKTTTAGALAQIAAEDGKRVLMIDLDSQCSLSIWHRADLSKPNSYDVMTGRATAAEAIQPVIGHLSLICGHANLIGVLTKPGSAQRLREALQSVKRRYDLIIIDTPPAAGELQNNALFASNGLIIPLSADLYSLQAMYSITSIAEQIPGLKILGTVLTGFDGRAKISRYMRDTIAEKGAPLLQVIRRAAVVTEAQAMQQTLCEYAPKSKPLADYRELYSQLLQM